ncbi:MAG TPA: RuBisCO large subunit C-terminal-like domain-containing protein [Thermodesulfovibrionales bacterium]|nr:RuBisCO large subunit C-terminal-like domain-containing protein [Thermodesulfovibrionales bacterium]
MTDDKRITVTYVITAPSHDIEKVSEEIALEQTVEVPRSVVREERIFDEIVGKVISIEKTGSGDISRYLVRIAYPEIVTGFQVPQFMNLLYGNISFKPGIKITGINFSKDFVRAFRGPKFGIEGIRKDAGVFGRPLIATALKPIGTSADQIGAFCYRFSLSGIDIIKDDHGLVDFPFCGFRERVSRCMEAVAKAEGKTGKRALYFPNVTDSFERIMKNIEFGLEAGVGGFLVSPFLVGPDTVRYIAGCDWIDKPLMSHPSFSGNLFTHGDQGISPEVILGKFFRLIGVDCSVYPNFGGRFHFDRETCSAIAHSLTDDQYHLKRSFPTPAGGMHLDTIAETARFYGEDVILLVGGSLYSRSDDLGENVRYFYDEITEQKRLQK